MHSTVAVFGCGVDVYLAMGGCGYDRGYCMLRFVFVVCLCDQLCSKVDAATHIRYTLMIIYKNSITYMHSHMRGQGSDL